MNPHFKTWNERHKILRFALEKSRNQTEALEHFLFLHASVHNSRLSNGNIYSFVDAVFEGLSERQIKAIPQGVNHSIAWIIWHLARIEDVTMNILVANGNQVFTQNDWPDRLGYRESHTGNGVSANDVADMSEKINIKNLRSYRLAVARKTVGIIKKLKAEDFNRKVEPDRTARIWYEKAMLPKGAPVVDYWAGKTIAGLLLVPPTRHNMFHLNESLRIKQKVLRDKSLL